MHGDNARITPVAAIFAINGAVYGSLLPRYPQLADQVGATVGEFGVALAGIGVGGISGAFVATRGIRLLGGPSRALLVTGLAFLLSAVAVAAAPSTTLLTLAFTALGLFDGFVDTAMNQAGTSLRQDRGTSVMGRLHATLAGATVAAAAVGAFVAGTVPVLPHLVAVTALLSGVLLLALSSVSSDQHAVARVEERTARQIPAPADSAGDRPRRRSAWWAVVICGGVAAVLVELPAQEWSGLLLAQEMSASPVVAGLGPLVAVAGVLIGRLLLDPAVNTFGWLTVTRSAGAITAVGMTTGLLLGAATREPVALLIGLGLCSVGAGAAVPMLFDRGSVLASRVGLSPSAGPGLVSGVFRAGVLVSPLLVAGVAEVGGLFLALGITALAGVLLVAIARPLTR